MLPSEAQALGHPRQLDGSIAREPFWLSVREGSTLAWLHLPVDGRVRPNGVLICPPFGHEYAHAHRSMRHLADALAREGFLALRLDYLGTGTASGDETTPDLAEGWSASIRAGLDYLESLTDEPASVLGVRLGALLASAALPDRTVHAFVGWAPVTRGRGFVREAAATAKIAGYEPEDGFIESLGFRLTDGTADALNGMNLAKSPVKTHRGSLIVERSDQPTADLGGKLAAIGEDVTVIEQDDFLDMMAEPHNTTIPYSVISDVSAWLAQRTEGPNHAIGSTKDGVGHLGRTRGVPSRFGRWAEELVLVPMDDGSSLFCVALAPPEPAGSGAYVILPNAGAVHHVGPNRLYVEASRALADAGLPSLRLDMRNLGDSCVGSPEDENHPYPATATEDLRTVVAWAHEKIGDRALLTGLCSGAHASLHATAEIDHPGVMGVICVNPLTFRYVEGMSLDQPSADRTTKEAAYYRMAAVDPDRWRKLFSGGSDPLRIASFVGRRTAQKAADGVRAFVRRLGLGRGSDLDQVLKRIADHGRGIRFVFSSTDPGLEMLTRRAGGTVRRLRQSGVADITIVPDADHTFSRKRERSQGVADIVIAAQSFIDLPFDRIGPGGDLWSKIGPGWARLTQEGGLTSAFMSPEWTECWLQHYGQSRNTRAIVAKDEAGSAVGYGLVSAGTGTVGPIPVSQTYLNASGVPGIGCDHNEILTAPQYRRSLLRSLIQEASSLRTDEIALEGVGPDLVSDFEAALGRPYWRGYSSESPYVDLVGIRASGKPYLSSLSSNTRSQIRRSLRAFSAEYGPSRVDVAATPDEKSAWLDELIGLHEATWERRGEAGAFDGSLPFHRTILERTAGQTDFDELRVDLVRVRFGDTTLGVLYNLVLRGHVQFYQSGLFYPEDRRLQPGLVTHALVIEHYLTSGEERYDFLGGEPEPVRYKRSLSTDADPLVWANFSSSRPKMSTIRLLRRAWRMRGENPEWAR